MILFQSNGLVRHFFSPNATFHTRSLFSSFFSYEKGKLVLKFATLDQVKPSILSFIVCRSVCCPLLPTDQKLNYILSKRALGSVLRGKKTLKTPYIKEYIRTRQHWKPFKKLKRFLQKNLQFRFVFCSSPRAKYSSRTFFLTANHPYRVCEYL